MLKSCFISILMITALSFTACQESMEQRAEREAKNFTHKFCPTPFVNNIRTDSVTFNKTKLLYTYHCTFNGILDNQDVIDANKQKILDVLRNSIRESTSMKPYIEAGFHFRYICHSDSTPEKTLIQADF